MANESIFADEWRESLRAHYQHVIRNNDQVTLKTLVGVLHDVGFTDDELRQLAFEATLRAEDVADDFVPDMEILSGVHPVVKPDALTEPVPPEDASGDDLGLTLEDALAVNEIEDLGEALPLEGEEDPPPDDGDAMADEDGDEADEPPKQIPGIQQLSLF